MSPLHVYGVVGDGTAPDSPLVGLDGCQVSTISHLDLAALVSLAPLRAYQSMRRDEVLRCLAAHQAVIEQVMAEHTVVPVKFGTTARDEAEVRKILERGSPQLSAALLAMEGKIELDLVAQWKDLNSVFRQIGDEPELRRQKAAIAPRSPQETTEERIRIGQTVKARLDQRREERAGEIVEALTPLAQNICPHALLGDRMILNTAFLVDKAMEGEVGRTLERLDDRYRDAIDFRCVGPLPPYSFSTVEVRTFEVEEIDRARRCLDLKERATLQEVKEHYRRLAHRCHPDTVGPQPAGPFEVLTEAYRLLGEYCQVGSSFLAPDVREAVAIKLLQWPLESSRA